MQVSSLRTLKVKWDKPHCMYHNTLKWLLHLLHVSWGLLPLQYQLHWQRDNGSPLTGTMERMKWIFAWRYMAGNICISTIRKAISEIWLEVAWWFTRISVDLDSCIVAWWGAVRQSMHYVAFSLHSVVYISYILWSCRYQAEVISCIKSDNLSHLLWTADFHFVFPHSWSSCQKSSV